MALTPAEQKAVSNGQKEAVVRAVVAAKSPTPSVTRVIATGDNAALAKVVGATGPAARILLDGDEAHYALALNGLV